MGMDLSPSFPRCDVRVTMNMLKCFCLSLAIHGLILGSMVRHSLPDGIPGPPEDGNRFTLHDAEETEDSCDALAVSLPEPAVDVRKMAASGPARRTADEMTAAAGLGPNRPIVLPAPRVLQRRALPAAGLLASDDSLPCPSGNAAELFVHYAPQLEKIPAQDVKQIAAKLRADYGVDEHAYEPLREAKDARGVDVDHSVAYYRLATRDGQQWFQELVLDRKGNYLVVSEKPEAQMDFADKVKLRVFANPAMSSVRNLALGLVEQKINGQEKRPEPEPPPRSHAP